MSKDKKDRNPTVEALRRDIALFQEGRAVSAKEGQMVTTAWVLTELGDAMSDPRKRPEFVATLNDLKANPQMRIISPDQDLFDKGAHLYAQRGP